MRMENFRNPRSSAQELWKLPRGCSWEAFKLYRDRHAPRDLLLGRFWTSRLIRSLRHEGSISRWRATGPSGGEELGGGEAGLDGGQRSEKVRTVTRIL